MDVELLRPGTVPISKDTVLWFEFLLDPNLLLSHLEKEKSDPAANDLIIKFTTPVLDSIKNDTKRLDEEQQQQQQQPQQQQQQQSPPPQQQQQDNNSENVSEQKQNDSLKNFALKILTLKIVAYMKWNLDRLETKLPVKIQICILQDLLYFTNENTQIEIPNVPDCDLLTVSDQYLFGLILYHRWLIRMVIQQGLSTKVPKQPLGELIFAIVDDYFLTTPEQIMASINFLNAVLSLNRTPKLLTFDAFVMLNEDTKQIEHDWSKSTEITRADFESQLHYDLACFYFHRENYELARQHFIQCSECYQQAQELCSYASFSLETLDGFLSACNFKLNDCYIAPNLVQQMHASVADNYIGILNILQEDNRAREIPMSYRTILELDIQGALSSGKFTVARDLLSQIQMLNVVRTLLDGKMSYTGNTIHRLKYGGTVTIDMLFWAIHSLLKNCTDNDREMIKNFFVKLLMTEDIPELFEKLTTDSILKNLLNSDDFETISKAHIKYDDVFVPDNLMKFEWLTPSLSDRRNTYLELKILEQKLISTYNPDEIRDLLQKISTANPLKQVWHLNSNWALAIPLQSVVMSMTRGFLQDFSFTLLAKSRELMHIRNFETSMELLTILETEIKTQNLNSNIGYKLSKMIGWEMLIVQITQLFDEWPAEHLNKQAVAIKCHACLSALESGDTVIPRVEVVEQCAVCLLNLNEWEYLCGLEKRWNYFEMAAAVAYACQDLVKYKGNKKVSRDMWDLILPIFGPSTATQTKRSSSGNATVLHRDSPTHNNKPNLIGFLSCLRDVTVLNVVISMLARLCNVLKDESSLELIIDYIVLWPAVVSNANSYNVKSVYEVLLQLVLQSLKFYPNNIPWLKIMGDINFGNCHYKTALKYYIEALMVATDYFSQPINKQTVDDHVFRRMIKCCTQINCHTQAAILCQFLDEVDYALAFKCLGENKSAQCYDAIDSYYNCIWDTTVLEYLVHLHHKRDENHRKQQAIKAIGMLELNSNNNEEIQREAMTVRKTRFLRALAKQYLSKDF